MTHPPPRAVAAATIRARLPLARRVAVLDDDPTGTQTVRDVPVLTRWTVDDVAWALAQDSAGFFVLTNTRSLDPADAAARTREVASACLAAAERAGVEIAFASRSDSTLRGHFPLETDVLAEVCAAHHQPIDAILLIPSYVDAGRVTIDTVHWIRTPTGRVPVGQSEFARDATFGYTSSHLGDWVAERTAGRIRREAVRTLTLGDIRSGDDECLAERLVDAAGPTTGANRQPVVWAVDAECDDDLRTVALAVLRAESAGRRFLYRVGPSFVRARLGQQAAPPLSLAQVRTVSSGRFPDPTDTSTVGSTGTAGLVVVGSHVDLTTRQLDRLRQRVSATHVVLDVPRLLGIDRDEHIADTAAAVARGLADGLVVLSTSRAVVRADTPAAGLAIARRVSAAVSRTVRAVLAHRRPAFLVAKGGITSADLATDAVGIDRAWVRGCLLPGIVSLWEPVGLPGPALPYVVFAGNVGDDDALADVVDRLSRAVATPGVRS
ncbi:MAG: hypothetical protein IRY85_02220 [Micromonosporaceae bacterium]|nr:hypothetical protein [Micromonosporaceae bacterium]